MELTENEKQLIEVYREFPNRIMIVGEGENSNVLLSGEEYPIAQMISHFLTVDNEASRILKHAFNLYKTEGHALDDQMAELSDVEQLMVMAHRDAHLVYIIVGKIDEPKSVLRGNSQALSDLIFDFLKMKTIGNLPLKHAILRYIRTTGFEEFEQLENGDMDLEGLMYHL